ncbi:hypothetical protein [Streptomyces sp. NPDC090135]|uniref:hypothetical protein n=1 Tax=Streptomyces sp. NPDC090135 TaxID=3365957 RepID=UPI00382BCC72
MLGRVQQPDHGTWQPPRASCPISVLFYEYSLPVDSRQMDRPAAPVSHRMLRPVQALQFTDDAPAPSQQHSCTVFLLRHTAEGTDTDQILKVYPHRA